MALCLAGFSSAAQAAPAQGVGGVPPPGGGVSATPVSTTPHLKATADNPVEEASILKIRNHTFIA